MEDCIEKISRRVFATEKMRKIHFIIFVNLLLTFNGKYFILDL